MNDLFVQSKLTYIWLTMSIRKSVQFSIVIVGTESKTSTSAPRLEIMNCRETVANNTDGLLVNVT